MENVKSFSERLRKAREVRGYTQERLGELAGSWDREVSRWEQGKHPPSFRSMAKLAAALDVSLGWLAGGEGEDPFGEKESR